ncbi:MAG: sulfur transferase domain-containing protein, partial [Sphingomonadales bacterium]
MFLRVLVFIVLGGFIFPVNAQDLAEVDMVNPRQPLENLVTGGQPSEDDLKKFAEEGFGLVINLRRPGEFDDFDEAEVVENLGMKYINIPVRNMRDLTP